MRGTNSALITRHSVLPHIRCRCNFPMGTVSVTVPHREIVGQSISESFHSVSPLWCESFSSALPERSIPHSPERINDSLTLIKEWVLLVCNLTHFFIYLYIYNLTIYIYISYCIVVCLHNCILFTIQLFLHLYYTIIHSFFLLSLSPSCCSY